MVILQEEVVPLAEADIRLVPVKYSINGMAAIVHIVEILTNMHVV